MTRVVRKPVSELAPGDGLLCIVQPSAAESWRRAAEGYAACGLAEHVVAVEPRAAGWITLTTLEPSADPRRARAPRCVRIFDATWIAWVLADESHSGDADSALLPTGSAVAPPVPGRPSSPGQHPRLQSPRPRSLFEEVGDGR